jgi:hypothetical protein
VTPLRDGPAAAPVLWVTDAPVPGAGRRWGELQGVLAGQGIWPLVLIPLDGEEWAPWHNGELDPVSLDEVDGRFADRVLAGLWHAMAETTCADEELTRTPGAWGDAALELGLPDCWPGMAHAGRSRADPAAHAASIAATVYPTGLLGLVPADRGSDALAVLGWDGPQNHIDTADMVSVLRSWEDRFEARVIGLGFDTLQLSVAAPPMSAEHARVVAAEHFALCPDNIAQGTEDFDLYARHIRHATTWSFWWD